jgi:chromosome segregation ATPase
MCKKILIAGVAVVLGLLVVKKTELGSHLSTFWKHTKTSVRNAVPIDNEIDRLRDEIARLGKDYKTHYSSLAEEMVAINRLKKEITEVEKGLDKQKADIDTMKTDLKSGTRIIEYGDVRYSREQVERQLKRSFESYKRCEEGLKAKKELLEAREQGLAAAKDKLSEMMRARTEMEVELARLEAEFKSLQVAQTRSKFKLDDSDFARVKEAIARLQDRIETERTTAEIAGQFADGPVKVAEKVEKRDLLQEIEEYFNSSEVKVNTKVSQK